MDERANRLMNMFGDTLALSDQIHTEESDTDETYDRLRTRLARWNMAIENVAWLASIDMGDVKGRWDGEIQVHRLVKACLGARLWMILEKHLRLDTDLEEATVKGNPDLMKLIFQNLLDNAIKYTDRGGHIVVSVRKEANHVKVVFQDDGCGIPENILPDIFQRYSQYGDDPDTMGLGLGLAVVKEGTEVFGGTADVSSIEGKGSIITVWFPLDL